MCHHVLRLLTNLRPDHAETVGHAPKLVRVSEVNTPTVVIDEFHANSLTETYHNRQPSIIYLIEAKKIIPRDLVEQVPVVVSEES